MAVCRDLESCLCPSSPWACCQRGSRCLAASANPDAAHSSVAGERPGHVTEPPIQTWVWVAFEVVSTRRPVCSPSHPPQAEPSLS